MAKKIARKKRKTGDPLGGVKFPPTSADHDKELGPQRKGPKEGKHGEVTGEQLVRMADAHDARAKAHRSVSVGAHGIPESIKHQAIAVMHQESAVILRGEASYVRSKP